MDAATRRELTGRSGEAVRLVETVLARNPSQVQAGHLQIHLLEAADAKRAEVAADREQLERLHAEVLPLLG